MTASDSAHIQATQFLKARFFCVAAEISQQFGANPPAPQPTPVWILALTPRFVLGSLTEQLPPSFALEDLHLTPESFLNV